MHSFHSIDGVWYAISCGADEKLLDSVSNAELLDGAEFVEDAALLGGAEVGNLDASFIAQMEASGFSARRYAVWFQSELSRPVFLVALVLMAAAFTIGHVRGARVGLKVLFAVIAGFGLYYIRNFAQILGENGQIPVALAAWAPPVAALFLALGILLHLEDG